MKTLRSVTACAAFYVSLMLAGCGSGGEGNAPSAHDQETTTQNVDLGTYVGYYEVIVIFPDGKEREMYKLYTSVERPSVYLYYRPWTARDFDPVMLRRKVVNGKPVDRTGQVYFVDPNDTYEAYVID